MATAISQTGVSVPEESHHFVSKLKEGRHRFLSHVIEHSFACGRRSPEDFIRHFPPTAIMRGLEHQPNLRASILVLTTGLKKKIALKKSWEDSATDLQIALDENETDAESIVTLFDPDDRVRYLHEEKLWGFLTEGSFWKTSSSKKNEAESARSHMAFMLERALGDNLITHRDIVEGVTVDELSTRLPKSELGRLIQCALAIGEKGTPFTDADLLGTTPPETLAQYIPLPHIWESVVEPKIAVRHGYVRKGSGPQEPAVLADATPVPATEQLAEPAGASAGEGAGRPLPPLPAPPARAMSPGAGSKSGSSPMAKVKSSNGKELPSGIRKAFAEEDLTQEFEVTEDEIKVM